VILAKLIPWQEIEKRYMKNFSEDDEDAPKQRKLIIDCSCAPGDIRYPRTRTYRRNARKEYVKRDLLVISEPD